MQRDIQDDAKVCLRMGNKHLYGLVFALLFLHGSMLAWGAWRHSPTWDEVAYLPAGISHWQLGDFKLYGANPPLVRMVAAVPVILAKPQTDWRRFDSNWWAVGIDFMKANGERSFWLFTLARFACIPFSLLGGYICFRWARELFGDLAGVLSLVLWCFSPSIIAHGQLITPDAATSALGVAGAYVFWRWLRNPSWRGVVIAGLVLGLAELVKGTWIVLFGLWPALWLIWRWAARRELTRQQWFSECRQLTVMFLLALFMINLGYGFTGSFKRLGDYTFKSQILGGEKGRDRNRFRGTWLAEVPVPAPEAYVGGIDGQKANFGKDQWSYFRGEWRKGGRWYYYLYALAVKVPLGTLGLVALTLLVSLRRLGYTVSWRDELVLIAPLLVVLALVSSQTGFNRHSRYVLPVLPFAFIWVSRLAQAVSLRHRRIALLTAVALFCSVASSLWIYPHSLSYFNELCGGPRAGADHLSASNTDWGQDLLYLRRWQQEHPEVRSLKVAFDGGYSPQIFGMDFPRPPVGPKLETSIEQDLSEVGPQPGWYAVSVNIMRWRNKRYAYFLHFQPVDMIGYSMCIYHITPDEANRVRRKLGLPELTWTSHSAASMNRKPGGARLCDDIADEAVAQSRTQIEKARTLAVAEE